MTTVERTTSLSYQRISLQLYQDVYFRNCSKHTDCKRSITKNYIFSVNTVIIYSCIKVRIRLILNLILIFLLRRPRVWFAFFVVMSICLDHERSSAMVTPKYFSAGTLSSSTLCRMYLVLRGLPFCDLKLLKFRGVKLHILHIFP